MGTTSASTIISVAGQEVRLTNPDKVFLPARGETKADVVRYYLAVGEPLLRAVGGRPTLLERHPDGATGKSFFQKRVPADAPEWLQTTVVATPNGTTSTALVLADLAHVVWMVNLGCLGLHPWAYLAADPEYVDELRIDLDPQPGIRFEQVREAALEARALLEELGITAYPKTTASRGLHLYVRLQRAYDAYQVRAAAVALARELERRRPDLLTAAWWKEERGTRVFVDYNQNAPHKTVFGPWAVRARVGGQVSTPLFWDEVGTVEPDQFTVATIPTRLAAIGDPWAEMTTAPQSLEPLLVMSARDLASGLQDAPWPPVYPKQPNEPPRVAPSRARRPDQ